MYFQELLDINADVFPGNAATATFSPPGKASLSVPAALAVSTRLRIQLGMALPPPTLPSSFTALWKE